MLWSKLCMAAWEIITLPCYWCHGTIGTKFLSLLKIKDAQISNMLNLCRITWIQSWVCKPVVAISQEPLLFCLLQTWGCLSTPLIIFQPVSERVRCMSWFFYVNFSCPTHGSASGSNLILVGWVDLVRVGHQTVSISRSSSQQPDTLSVFVFCGIRLWASPMGSLSLWAFCFFLV